MLSINYSFILFILKILNCFPFELIQMIMKIMLGCSLIDIHEKNGLFTIYYNNKVHFHTRHDEEWYIEEFKFPNAKRVSLHNIFGLDQYFIMTCDGKLFAMDCVNKQVLPKQRMYKTATLVGLPGSITEFDCTMSRLYVIANKCLFVIDLVITKIICSNVKSIMCGKHHCMMLTYDNSVYVTGDNNYGQRGQGDNDNNHYDWDKLSKINIPSAISISSKNNMLAVMTIEGVFVWGCNENNMLGFKSNDEIICTPTLLNGIKNVNYCKSTTLFTTLNDDVYVVEKYLIGRQLSSNFNVNELKKINISNIKNISCNRYDCFIVTKDHKLLGYVYACCASRWVHKTSPDVIISL